MTNKEKFDAIGKFIKDHGDKEDCGSFVIYELMEKMGLEHTDEFDPAYWISDNLEPYIDVWGMDGGTRHYHPDQAEELIKDLKKRLKCVKELCDLLEKIDK